MRATTMAGLKGDIMEKEFIQVMKIQNVVMEANSNILYLVDTEHGNRLVELCKITDEMKQYINV